MRAVAVADESSLSVAHALEQVRAQPQMEGRGLVAQVSPVEPYVYTERGRVRISASSMTGPSARSSGGLEAAGAAVNVQPPSATADELAGYDGVLLAERPR